MNTLDHRVARWMTNIAEALTRIGGLPLSYGEFYVSDVTISFDGEEVQLTDHAVRRRAQLRAGPRRAQVMIRCRPRHPRNLVCLLDQALGCRWNWVCNLHDYLITGAR